MFSRLKSLFVKNKKMESKRVSPLNFFLKEIYKDGYKVMVLRDTYIKAQRGGYIIEVEMLPNGKVRKNVIAPHTSSMNKLK